jgi:LPS-assembly protein
LLLALVLGTTGALAQTAPQSHGPHHHGIPPLILKQHQGPLSVKGRDIIYNSKTDTFLIRGNAVMTQAHTVLTADEIWIMRSRHQARAEGHVHLTDPEGVVTASSAMIDLPSENLVLVNGDILSAAKTYHLRGKKIIKSNGQHYEIDDGFFTTCGDNSVNPDWSLNGKKIDLHMGQSGVAHNAHFDILGYPILTIPEMPFPADTSRHSGFLSPRMGYSGLRGAQFLQPYYIDINKSSDATVAMDVETSQRVGLMTEYRLTNGVDDYFWVDGAFYDESMRSQANRNSDIVDNQVASPFIPVSRYDIIGTMRQHLTDSLTIYGNGMMVSDPFLLRELNLWTLSRYVGSNSFNSMRLAPSNFGLLDEFEGGFMRFQGVVNQDLIQPQRYALQTLPSFLISGFKNLFGGLAYISYNATADNFWRQTGTDGQRLDLNPSLTLPFRFGDYIYGSGSMGFEETLYEAHGQNINITPVGTHGLLYNNALSTGSTGPTGFFHREVPYMNFEASTLLERVYDAKFESIEQLKHIIEPFVSYAYVPNVNQTDLPLYDWIDRYNGRSLLTYGITSRLMAKFPGLSKVPEASAAQPGGVGTWTSPDNLMSPGGLLEPDSVSPFGSGEANYNGNRIEELVRLKIEQAYDTSHAIAPDGSGMSDVETSIQLLPTKIATFGAQMDYDPRQRQQINYTSIYFDFQPPWMNNTPKVYMGRASTGSYIQISYNYVGTHATVLSPTENNASELVMLRAYYDLFDRLGVYFAPEYDVASGQMLAAEYGIRIKSPCDCWAVDFGISDTINPNEVGFQVQATLGGLGSFGQMPFGRNPFQILGVNKPPGFIPGYY